MNEAETEATIASYQPVISHASLGSERFTGYVLNDAYQLQRYNPMTRRFVTLDGNMDSPVHKLPLPLREIPVLKFAVVSFANKAGEYCLGERQGLPMCPMKYQILPYRWIWPTNGPHLRQRTRAAWTIETRVRSDGQGNELVATTPKPFNTGWACEPAIGFADPGWMRF